MDEIKTFNNFYAILTFSLETMKNSILNKQIIYNNEIDESI